ncbi:collagen binding domain-containing protein [Levilactobacillus zymae]|uniref:collagen binding domain-containing protein n=1 Tax=Levilactobacillus zymae TaxID=267363 RepID=UPI0028B27BFE|nr:collagen binding domain-containing protein [Levilactobacillus zymae]MDT6979840.1 collagen binding domain-containing protein [Levilactobacillus zymae]
MRNNHRFTKWLIALVSLLALVVCGRTTHAQAATIDGSPYVTSAKVTNGPDFKLVDTINVEYHLEFGSTALHNGDKITIPLPDNLKSSKESTFDVTGPDGETVIGTGHVAKGGNSIEITLNEKVENLDNKVLDLKIATKYAGTNYGEQDVNFPNNHHDKINIVEDLANLSKKGVIQDNNTVRWTVLVNRQELEMKNLKVEDTIGAHQTMIHDVTVSKAYWVSPTSYKRETPALAADEYTVNYTDEGFTLKFKDTVNDMYAIDYYTKVDDPSLIHSGYVFTNQATMTWGGGTSGTPNSEKANGKVSTSSTNSGSGNGNNVDKDGNEDKDGDGDIDENGNTDITDPGTGTIDVDAGTETPAEEAAREKEEAAKKQPAKVTAKTKTQKAKTAAATKAQAVKPVVATQSHAKRAHNGTKLPQTNEQVGWNWAAFAGLSLLMVTTAAVIRRHF